MFRKNTMTGSVEVTCYQMVFLEPEVWNMRSTATIQKTFRILQ